MYEEIKIEFSDGTYTLEWYSEDDWNNIQDFLVDAAEAANTSAENITDYSFTSRTDEDQTY